VTQGGKNLFRYAAENEAMLNIGSREWRKVLGLGKAPFHRQDYLEKKKKTRVRKMKEIPLRSINSGSKGPNVVCREVMRGTPRRCPRPAPTFTFGLSISPFDRFVKWSVTLLSSGGEDEVRSPFHRRGNRCAPFAMRWLVTLSICKFLLLDFAGAFLQVDSERG